MVQVNPTDPTILTGLHAGLEAPRLENDLVALHQTATDMYPIEHLGGARVALTAIDETHRETAEI
ncbi:hypothetical protein RRF57_010704 [Xylaria bambusicola]|uniref:Uncharacterized protein n=1 Tax=Xylaria bambusicola TaxID=326684 RepID=A0AAN7USU7_9PEZI